MIYLWQRRDDEWRRRQKYAIKSVSDWEEERRVVDERLSFDGAEDDHVGALTVIDTDDDISSELAGLDEELEAHLSGEFT